MGAEWKMDKGQSGVGGRRKAARRRKITGEHVGCFGNGNVREIYPATFVKISKGPTAVVSVYILVNKDIRLAHMWCV